MGEESAEQLNALSDQVLAGAIEVHRLLGPGFQEATYHRARVLELRRRNIAFASEVPVTLTYKGEWIGEGRINLLLSHALVIELKAADDNPSQFRRQLVA